MVDEQYIAAPAAAHRADKGRVLVSNRTTGHADLLSEQLFGILRHADRFDTVAGHAKRLFAAGWEDDGSGFIPSAYRELISRGLMVPKGALLKSILETDSAREAAPPVTSVIVTTRDRTPQLQRCLDGFIENMEKHGRNVDYLVIDNSKIETRRTKMEGVLTSFAARGAKVHYAGREEKVRFKNDLVRARSAEGLPEEVVDFCLFGDKGFEEMFGANRNAILLATAGELIVMTDDDTVCQPVVLGEEEKALALTSLNDPTLLQYFGDRRELIARVHPADINILSCHEKLLGRSIAASVTSLGPGCELDVGRIGPVLAGLLCRSPATVKATMAGIWGDSGMGSPNAALELMGESRDFIMRSKEEYARAKRSREVLRGVSRYSIGDGLLFMAVNSGLDNRTLLPPFLPAGRNEDGVFALSLRTCAEHGLIGYLPFAVLHSPDEVRRFPPDAFLDPAPRLAEIVSAIMRSFNPSPGRKSVSEKLSGLGRLFIGLGTLERDDFEAEIRTIWLATASRYIGYLEYLLDLYHGEPDHWAEDVLSLIENFKDFIVHRSPAVPRELHGSQSEDQAVETCRRMVRRFGELLLWWPVIDGAARQLRESGKRLVRRI